MNHERYKKQLTDDPAYKDWEKSRGKFETNNFWQNTIALVLILVIVLSAAAFWIEKLFK